MRHTRSFRFPKRILVASALLAVAPLSEAGLFRSDIDVQTYRDYAENRGVFKAGATNVTVYRSDGSVAGVIAVVPDFGATNDGAYVTMLNASFGGSVNHVSYTTAPTFSQRFNDTGLAYSIFGDTYHEVASITPASGYDYKIMRYSKIFIDAAPTPLMTDTAYISSMTGKQITRVGGGSQAIATGSGTQVDPYPGGDNYGWLSGGWNKVDSVSSQTMTETVGGVTSNYTMYNLNITLNQTPDSTLEIGTLGGDSGSPVYVWNPNTNRYEIIAFNQAGGGGPGYGKWSVLRSAPTWSVAQMNSYNDPNIVDTAGGGVITMSAADATGLGTLTQGATVWNFHGLANGVSSATATDAQMNAAKNLIFSGAGNTIRLSAASVDLGAGSMTFTGGGTYTLDDNGVTTRRLNSAGYIIEGTTKLISKITGSAGDDWRKIGTGTLRIEGSGANAADLSLGEGLVELNRTGGAAINNVLITSGRGTVRMIGDNQISGTVAFGRLGGTLDLYGHNFSRSVVYAMDGGAKITNTAANTTSTFTWTGSGAGPEQTFRGGFADGGSLANGLLNVVVNPTTPAGSVLTLRGNSTNMGGYAINGGEVVLRGYNTPHAGATNGEQPGEAFPDDWNYAKISTGTITVASGAKFTFADHARLDGNVTVNAGGTFAITENLFKSTAESVDGGLVGTPSSTLYGHQSGTVTLNGATAAMIATVSGNTDQSLVYARNITGTGAFTKNGVGTLTLSGANTFSGAKTHNGGTLIGSSLAALGDTTTNKWSMTSASSVIAATGATAAQMKAKLTTGSVGTLALAGTNPDATPDMTGYSGLYLGAIGAQTVGTSGTSSTLTAWNGTGWNLGGGGGTLTMNLKLSGSGALNIGNGSNTGTVVLTNANNSTTTGGAAFTGLINVNTGVALQYTDINALGTFSGSDRIAVAYGARLSLGTGANATTVFNAVTTGSAGVLGITGTDSNAYNFSAQGLTSAALGANGTATYSGTLTPGAGGYKFGGNGALTVTSVLSGANTLSADGQGSSGGVTTLSGNNTFTGAVTVKGGTVNGILGAHTLKLGANNALGTGNAVTLNDGGTLDINGKSTSVGTLTGTAASSLLNGSTTAATLSFNQTADATMAGTIAAGAGALNLVKNGSGTLTLSGNNAQTGTVTINAGAIRVASGSALGVTGNVVTVASGGALDLNGNAVGEPTAGFQSITISGTGSGSLAALHNTSTTTGASIGMLTLATDATLGGSTNNNTGVGINTSGINLGGKTLTITSGRLIVDNTDAFTGGGNIVVNNGGVIYFAGNNAGSGTGATITLKAGGTMDCRDYQNSGLANRPAVVLDGGTLSNGLLGSNGGGAGTILYNGVSVTANGGTLTGANSYNASMLRLAGALSGSGALTVNGGAGVEFQGSTSGFTGNIAINSGSKLSMNGSANQSLSGVISGSGALTKSGTTTLTLTGANTYSGTTTINAGTIALGTGGTSGSLGAGAVTNNGALTFNRSNTLTVANAISGTGTVAQNGTGMTVLSGGNTYSGGATVNAGTLRVTSVTGLGTGTVKMNGGTLSFALQGLNFNSIAGTSMNTGAVSGGTFTSDFSPLHNTSGNVVPGNTTYAYTGKAYLTAGQWSFGENFDDAAYVKVNDTVVVNNTGWNTPTSGSVTIAADGWYDFDVRAWNGGGGTGGVSGSGWGPTKGFGVKTGASTTDGTQYAAFGADAAGIKLGTGGTLVVSNAVNLAANATVEVINDGLGGATRLSGVVSGTGALTKTGAGTLILSGTNTYAGGTIVNTGTLVAGNSGALGTGVVTVNAATLDLGANAVTSGALTLNGGTVQNGTLTAASYATSSGTVSANLAGAGALSQNGAGTTILSGNNTYTGNTTITSGTLAVTGTLGSGNYTGAIVDNGALVLATASNQTLSGIISGTGSLMQSGSGNTVLAGANTYSGTTTINGGTLTIGNGVTSGTLGTGAVTNNAALVFNRSDAITVDNTISGTGAVSQIGTGTITLSADNTYSGGTTISGGTVRVADNDSALGAGTIGFTGDATLATASGGGVRSLANDVTVAPGATASLDGGYATLTVAGNVSGAGNLAKVSTGTVVLTGNNTYSGTTTIAATSGGIQIGNGGASGTLGSGAVSIGSGGSLTFNRSDSVTVANTIDGDGTLAFTGTGVSGQSAYTLTGDNSGLSGIVTATNARAQVDNSSGNRLGTGALTTGTGGQFFLTGGTIANAMTISGNGWQEAAGLLGALRLAGGATVSGAVTLAGDTRITAYNSTGTVSGAIGETGGSRALEIGGSGQLAGTVIFAGANTYTGTTTISSGTLLIGDGGSSGTLGSGSVVNNATLAFNRSDAVSVGNTISGSGSVSQIGGGTTTLTAANSYTGGTSVNSGTLALGNAAALGDATNTLAVNGGTLDLGAYSVTTGAVTVSGGTIQNGTLTGSSYATQSGTVSAVLAGSGALTQNGTGTTTLSGNNTFTGGTTVASGTLALGNAGALGATTNALTATGGTLDLGANAVTAGTVTVSGGDIRNGTLTGSSYATSSGSVSAALAGSGALTQNGAGTTVLSGNNTYAGATTVSAGTLQIGNGGTTGSLGTAAASVASGATLTFNRSNALTVTNALGGAGTIRQAGTGNLTLQNSGSASLASFLVVDSGTVTIASGGFGANRMNGNGLVTVNSGAALVISGTHALGGSNGGMTESVVLNGGTMTLNNEQYFNNLTLNGATVGGAGQLRASNATNWVVGGTSASTVANNIGLYNTANFNVADATGSSATDLTVSGIISTPSGYTGALTKTGVGTMALTGANTYTTGTTVNGGTLLAGHNAAFGTGAVTVNNTGTLNSGTGRTLANAFTINTGGALGGAATFTGTVTINSGATLTPGSTGAIGKQTFGNGVTLASGAAYLWEISGIAPATAGVDFDQITVNAGTMAIASSTTLKVAALNLDYTNSFWDSSHAFTFATKSGTGTITGTFTALDASLAGSYSSEGSWSLLTAANGDLQALWTAASGMQGMSLQAVPEPSTYGLIGAGVLALAAAIRRRRKAA